MFLQPTIAEGVTCLIARIDDLDSSDRYPVEEDYVRHAVEKRRVEFYAGRTLARMALAKIGRQPGPLPAGKHRLVTWPAGVVGSISHSAGLVSVAVSVSDTILSLGLDIERRDSVAPTLYPSILLSQEQDEVANSNMDPTVYFSCKEALFKAVFPVHNEYFDFVDVELTLTENRFSARSVNPDLSSNPSVSRGVGYRDQHRDHVISLCVIPGPVVASSTD